MMKLYKLISLNVSVFFPKQNMVIFNLYRDIAAHPPAQGLGERVVTCLIR